jgi:hypothetical protein
MPKTPAGLDTVTLEKDPHDRPWKYVERHCVGYDVTALLTLEGIESRVPTFARESLSYANGDSSPYLPLVNIVSAGGESEQRQ